MPGFGQPQAGVGANPTSTAAPTPNLFNFGLNPAAAGTVGNPEEVYASQLTQLSDMGFSNRDQNIRALQATFGDVNAAVERILSGLV